MKIYTVLERLVTKYILHIIDPCLLELVFCHLMIDQLKTNIKKSVVMEQIKLFKS